MSGGFGSVDKPYVEMPYAGRIREVHWADGGVKWPGGQSLVISTTSYLQKTGSLSAVPDGSIGTLSFWYRQNATTSAGVPIRIAFTADSVVEPGRSGAVLGVSIRAGGGNVDTVSGLGSMFVGIVDPRLSTPPGGSEHGVELDDAGDFAVPVISKWYHLHVIWDSSSGSISLRSNGVLKAASVVTSFSKLGPPFTMPWSLMLDTKVFVNTGALPVPHPFSIGDFWLKVGQHVTVDKFYNVTTGRRVYLGPNGELPTGSPPHFYFHRNGAPDTFDQNLGTAGAFTLVGTAPITETAPLKVDI